MHKWWTLFKTKQNVDVVECVCGLQRENTELVSVNEKTRNLTCDCASMNCASPPSLAPDVVKALLRAKG